MKHAAAVLLLAATTLLTGCAASTAGLTPPAPGAATPTVKELAQGLRDDDVKITVGGPTQVTVRDLTLQPGASTGKHCHYGQLIGVITQGELTHYAPVYPGGVHVYRAGDAIVEGPGYVHEGRNQSTRPLTLTATYITPTGKPLAESQLTSCDTPNSPAN